MKYLAVLLFIPVALVAQNKRITPQEYIEKYKDIAVREMQRFGIPASITLSQGYLESGCGNSTLAREANNHFGIKCHKSWTGKEYYIEDDDYDENGNLKKSCFRVYSNADESFVDHSEFLSTRTRYAFLFELRSTDYVGWAKGLSKAGYATNPKYSDLLVGIIERYELYNYDTEKKNKFLAGKKNKKEVFEINEIPAIAYNSKLTVRQVRDKFFTGEWQIYKYNDLDKKDKWVNNMVIYLKPKRKKNKVHKTHVVEEGETMHYISQLKGIKLKSLYKLNLMQEGEEPQTGEVLSLYGKRVIKPNVKSGAINVDKKYFTLNDEGELYNSNPSKVATREPGVDIAKQNVVQKKDGKYHKVRAGETLMSISRAYNMSWLTLKDQNNLKSDNLEVGQLLLIEPQATAAIAGGDVVTPKYDLLNAQEHLVKDGESLFSISRTYGLTVAELMRLNKLSEPKIANGVTLRVNL